MCQGQEAGENHQDLVLLGHDSKKIGWLSSLSCSVNWSKNDLLTSNSGPTHFQHC